MLNNIVDRFLPKKAQPLEEGDLGSGAVIGGSVGVKLCLGQTGENLQCAQWQNFPNRTDREWSPGGRVPPLEQWGCSGGGGGVCE